MNAFVENLTVSSTALPGGSRDEVYEKKSITQLKRWQKTETEEDERSGKIQQPESQKLLIEIDHSRRTLKIAG